MNAEHELAVLLNKHSAENESGTPDFAIAARAEPRLHRISHYEAVEGTSDLLDAVDALIRRGWLGVSDTPNEAP